MSAKKKEVLHQIRIKESTFDDNTVVREERKIKDGEIVGKSKRITYDNSSKKLASERVLISIVEISHYVYDNGTELIKEKHYRITPKRKEKKLEKDLVTQVM